MTPSRKGWRVVGDLKICHVLADSIVFKQIYYSFLRMEGKGVGVTKLVIFCGHHTCMTPCFIEAKHATSPGTPSKAFLKFSNAKHKFIFLLNISSVKVILHYAEFPLCARRFLSDVVAT